MKATLLKIICTLLFISLSVSHALADAGIANSVLKAIGKSPAKQSVLVLTKSGTSVMGLNAVGAAAPRGLPRAMRVKATPAQIRKLACSSDVIAIVPDAPPVRPPLPGPQVRPGMMPAAQKQPLPYSWFASDLVGARAAWQSGYTGKGVKVAVIDEGIDFANPDLQGTQARVENPMSPYYGWPIVFDSHSMAHYATYGDTASTYYSNTKAIITEANPKVAGITYKLPHTSKSGVYHFGAHPSYLLMIMPPQSNHATVLVADEHVAGVYDTVYVDLNKDHDFTDEKPCRKGDEISWHDLDGDGFADLSGGMVYFIADGVHPIPASDWLYHLKPPANGSLVCFAGSFDKGTEHGTLVASAIAAQGKIGTDYPPYKTDNGGVVRGMAPDAKIISIGNVYNPEASMYDAILFSTLGYDGIPNSGDEPDIVNMSFGYSDVANDGWDYLARYLTYLNVTQAPRTTFVAAAGNGGPGYGTITTPASSPSVISVGASTLYGSVPLIDDISSADQILYGDIQPWSNRGPSALGTCEPDVAAVGAFATGDLPLDGDGAYAWALWAGTSLSCPVTAGVLADIYQAYIESHGSKPTYDLAKSFLISGASDLGYPVLEQGAGEVNADASIRQALGKEVTISPSTWQVGQTVTGFPATVSPGQRIFGVFNISNPTSARVKADISADTFIKTSEVSFRVDTDTTKETPGMSGPSYLVDLLPLIPPGTDLMRVHATVPFNQLTSSAPTDPYILFLNGYDMAVFDWTDLNGNGIIWHDDIQPNGVVNDGELDPHELNRFSYDAPLGTNMEVSVKSPLSRYHNGLFLGFEHFKADDSILQTNISVTIEFYRRNAWKMVQVSPSKLILNPGSRGVFRATFASDNYQKPGMYSGSIKVTCDNGKSQVIPVTACVTNSTDPWALGTLSLAGSDGFSAPYDNGILRGAVDWSWRQDTGDWRPFFFTPTIPSNGQVRLLANANWQDYPTDVDISLFGPNRDDFFSKQLPSIFGPYALAPIGESWNTNVSGSGFWPFFTNTGGTSEWVSGPMTDGLQLALLHCVENAGVSNKEPVNLNIGPVVITPSDLTVPANQPSSSTLTLTPYLFFPQGAEARAYGFTPTIKLDNQMANADPIDYPSASKWIYDITLTNAGLLEVSTTSPQPIDIDLYVVRQTNGNFDWTTGLVAFSANPGPNEKISIPLPADGTYRIYVHGYRVYPSPSPFSIKIDAIQGSDIAVIPPTGPLYPTHPAQFAVTSTPKTGGEAIIFLGPKGAPGAMQVRLHAK